MQIGQKKTNVFRWVFSFIDSAWNAIGFCKSPVDSVIYQNQCSYREYTNHWCMYFSIFFGGFIDWVVMQRDTSFVIFYSWKITFLSDIKLQLACLYQIRPSRKCFSHFDSNSVSHKRKIVISHFNDALVFRT